MKKLILAVFICCSIGSHAQYKTPYFNTITVDDGLPEANIQSVVEDKYGFLWFGTQNGLVRYDGYRLKQYHFFNDKGLPVTPAFTGNLFEDSKGKLWAHVYLEGVFYFDRSKDRFNIAPLLSEDATVLKKAFITDWKENKQENNLWVTAFDQEGNKNTLYSINMADNKVQIYSVFSKGNHYIPAAASLNINIDIKGKTWLVSDSLLSYYEPASKTFKPFFVLPDTTNQARIISVVADPVDADLLWLNITSGIPAPIEPKNVRKVMLLNTKTKTFKISAPDSNDPSALPGICFHTIVDSLKRVWLSTDKGVSLYNRQTGHFTQFPLSYSDNNCHTEVVTTDKDGNAWIAGNLDGLYFLDTKRSLSYPIKPNDGPGSLPAFKSISKIFFDRSGTLWINMPYEGIAWRNRQKTQFYPSPVNPFPKKDGIKEMPPQFSILGSLGDSICYIADTSSLFAWNTLKNTFETIDLGDKQLYKSLLKVSQAKDGQLWLAAGLNGVIQYNPFSKKITRYKHDPKDSLSLFADNINTILADKAGIIWIGSTGKGLLSLDPKTNTFTRYPFATNNLSRQVKDSLDDALVTDLYADQDGILWISTNSGALNSFNTQTKKFRSYLNYKESFFSVTCIMEDSRKRLWAGTYLSGIFLVDRKTGALKRFTENDGLVHNSVFSIQEDAAGNIWVATTKGLSRINPAMDKITNFTAARPVLHEFFMPFVSDRNGLFYLQARNGIITFNPMHLDESKTLPSVLIESIAYRSAGNTKDTTLFTEGMDKIELKHNENKISFQYVALHFADASMNQYAYKLEGYDKDWIPAGTQRSVTYSNLPPGQYTFKVKAANSDGVWNETGAGFVVIITPPWWKTWWAYCLYVFVFGAGIWAFIYYRSKALRRENQVLEEKVNHRTSQLQKSLQELQATQSQLIQSEKMASLGELTAGIAHEIQNPLNFVNNFSEVNAELIAEMKDELNKGNIDEAKSIADDIHDNEQKIIFHGKRADSIVKGMLQHSRSSSGAKEATDINALCDEYLRLSYHGLRAKDKSFNASYKTDLDNQVGKINVLPQDLGRVILNLLTNAFYAVNEKKKAGTEGYEPAVTVATKKTGNHVIISVSDNGNGVPARVLDKIFQPFFTTKPTGEGTGLGLSLSYDIITKGHGGELKVDTEEGKGTTFTIILPA